MKRRSWLLWGAGAAAAAAGAGWRAFGGPHGAPIGAPTGAPGSGEARSAAPAASGAGADELWGLSFPTPAGGEVRMAGLLGKPLVLNFWATWCPPCVKEMPEFDRFAKGFAAQGGQVVGLAVDNPKAVRDFLARSPVDYAIGLAGFDGTDLSRRLGNTSGALPFTAVFDRKGRITQRRLGETHGDDLIAWTRGL
jgi:thiol-disulfide isomerase/thioredoxin